MNKSQQPLKVEDGLVVTLDFKLTVDGELIEDTENDEPIQFIQGEGQLLPALEKHLYGMTVGDKKQAILTPTEGYGDYDPDAFNDVPRSEFPKEIPLKPGVELQLKDQDGEVHYAAIEAVDDYNVRLNFNHVLAGKDLHFALHIVALRTPTPEELDHGHVHSEHHHE